MSKGRGWTIETIESSSSTWSTSIQHILLTCRKITFLTFNSSNYDLRSIFRRLAWYLASDPVIAGIQSQHWGIIFCGFTWWFFMVFGWFSMAFGWFSMVFEWVSMVFGWFSLVFGWYSMVFEWFSMAFGWFSVVLHEKHFPSSGPWYLASDPHFLVWALFWGLFYNF